MINFKTIEILAGGQSQFRHPEQTTRHPELVSGSKNNHRKVAFTLAEVLITLGIIGVVAAMTMPTLIAKYKSMVLDNQFKKVYSTLNQATNYIVGEYGYVPNCYYGDNVVSNGSDCADVFDKLLEIFKVTKTCQNTDTNGCMPKYLGVDEYIKEQHKNDADYDPAYWENYARTNCGGFTANSLQSKKVYTWNDGTIMIPYDERAIFDRLLVIDINGNKGPNKWGYDVFGFQLKSNGNYFKYVGYTGGCAPVEEGGVSSYEKIKQLFGY